MIELNYMLSYGAAEPSLHLLWKFKLLEFLLPVHVSGFELLSFQSFNNMPLSQIELLLISWLQAAYLDEQATKEDAQASNMLMVSQICKIVVKRTFYE